VGKIPKGVLGHQAENDEETLTESQKCHLGLVPEKPARTFGRTTQDVGTETSGTLPILQSSLKFHECHELLVVYPKVLALLAFSAKYKVEHQLEEIPENA
jgi:hypothetical protein